MPVSRRATSQDVADLAGVSRSAVSAVLNGKAAGRVSAQRQAAVLAAAKELGYTPNPTALNLRTKRSATIGVVTDSVASSAHAGRLLRGASARAAEHGYLLLVIDTQGDPELERRAVDTLQNRHVDAFIYAAAVLKEHHPVSGPDTPIAVLANCFDRRAALTSFIPDEVGGSRIATRHLIEHGHRDVVMLTGTPDMVASRLREQGFSQAMAEAGLPVPSPVRAGWRIDDGHAAAIHVLTTRHPRPTGLVVANDRVATGVILAAATLGLSVPNELSVVGYDDDENIAPWLVPALTTVSLPLHEIGAAAVQKLLDDLAGDDDADPAGPDNVMLDCALVVRDSVASPPRQ